MEELVTQQQRRPSPPRLSGSLGPIAIIFMVVAAAAPMTTVGATVPVAIQIADGASFPIMYVIAAVILAFFACGFVAMTPYVPRAGAFYSYVTEGLGKRSGLGAAFLALLTYTTVQVAVHAFMGATLNDLVISHGGPHLGWLTWSMVSVAVVGILGYRDIDVSTKVLGLVLLTEITLCGVMAFAVLFHGGPQGYSTAAFEPSKILSGSPGLGLMFAISGFIGFEATAIYRDEARNPNRTVPRATYGALAVIGLFYAFVAWAMVTAWGDHGAVARAASNSATMLPDTAHRVLGAFSGDLVQYVLIGSIFACVLSFHNVIARYLFTLANTRAMPALLGRKHQRHGSPHVSSMVQTSSAVLVLVVCGLFRLDPVNQVFAWLVGVGTVGILVLMVVTIVAVLVFFGRNAVDRRPWNTRIAPGLGLVGLILALGVTVWNFPVLMGTKLGSWIAALVIVAAFVWGYLRRVDWQADEPAGIVEDD